MKKISITTAFDVFESIQELPEIIQNLMQEAIAIRKKAYAPYSNFKVGTALLLDNGIIILGSNQENAAYPSGLCAERVAIYYAGANYPTAKMVKMFITASPQDRNLQEPIPPCGRQARWPCSPADSPETARRGRARRDLSSRRRRPARCRGVRHDACEVRRGLWRCACLSGPMKKV